MGSTQIVIGDYEISVVDDHIGVERHPGDVFVDVSPEEWDPHRHYALNEDGLWISQWRSHLIRRTDGTGENVLVDTGMGPGPYDHGAEHGALMENLANLNVDDIDNVVITHCHGDHIGWNMHQPADPTAESTPTFANAKYHVAERDWDFYTRPENAVEAFDHQVKPLKAAGVLKLIPGEHEIMEGVKIVPTNGHTPGHQCVFVKSHGQTAVITGDLFHNVAQIAEQHWCPVFDWRTDLSTASRRWLLWRAMAEDWIVVSGHLSTGMSMGKVTEKDGRPTWNPV